MGNCGSHARAKDETEGRRESAEKSREIEHRLRAEAKKPKPKKILLLGTGEAGKSTFFRQLQIISGSSFGSRVEQQDLIAHNVLMAIQHVIISLEILGVPLSSESTAQAQTLRSLAPDTPHSIFITHLPDIQTLLADTGFQQVLDRGDQPSSLPYWLANLNRIASAAYTPTPDDLLRSRSRTSGIIEYTFKHSDGEQFCVVDVGGQRSERRKWIPCFSSVDCLIFFMAISEYDQMLEEDSKVNRMHESLRLFREIVNCQWFVNTPIVLMLNKRDLFDIKIKTRDIRCCFPDYTDGCDAEKASNYIRKHFLDTVRSNKTIFTHFTCATDTEQMRIVFGFIVQKAIEDSLEAGGL